jgi:hypothetical protein
MYVEILFISLKNNQYHKTKSLILRVQENYHYFHEFEYIKNRAFLLRHKYHLRETYYPLYN